MPTFILQVVFQIICIFRCVLLIVSIIVKLSPYLNTIDKEIYPPRLKFTFPFLVLGHGLRCHRVIQEICKLAGIKDIHAKVYGCTNPISVTNATMRGLLSQVSLH